MPISFLTNLTSLFVNRQLDKSGEGLRSAMEKLSSGQRINHAADDPAGSAIAANLNSEMRSNEAVQRNVADARSLFQVADNGLREIQNHLVRMRELALSAANDWIDPEEREALKIEYEQLRDEVDRIAQTTRFRHINLLNGGGGDKIHFLVGQDHRNELNQVGYVPGGIDATAGSLGVDGLSFDSGDAALDSIDTIDSSLLKLRSFTSQVGAYQSRMNSIDGLLKYQYEVTAADFSRIHDADVAKEAAAVLKYDMAQKAQIAVMAQANTLNNVALRLLG